MTAPVITCARHRIQTDGKGVTTLVCFYGCPLRCRYCLNAFSFAPDTKRKEMTPEALYEYAKCDELYYLATGGGVTFGGGEPLLYPAFIRQFREICGSGWHLCAESSLNVPWENVRCVAEVIDHFYIDCKDTNPQIYKSYTGQDNARMLSNLEQLLKIADPDKVTVRVPLIPSFNTEEDRQRSRELLTQMGVRHFDLFTYRT